MLKRVLACVLGLGQAANGVVMLAAGQFWYESVPGVTTTGPYNPHFVADVGEACLAAGLALAARGWRADLWPAAVAGSAFFVLHALIHISGLAQGHMHDGVSDIALVIVPAFVALWVSFPNKGDKHA